MTSEPFRVELSRRAEKDLRKVSSLDRSRILQKAKRLTQNPFPTGNIIRRIKGIRFPCYRLRVDGRDDSYRIFYGIEDRTILILRIVSKKSVDKIIESLLS